MNNKDFALIRVDRSSLGYSPEIVFANNRRSSFAVPTRDRLADDGVPNLEYDFYEVAKEDIDSALADITSRNPGVEVIAYMPVKSGVRPAGEMVIKSISEKGVLP